MTPTLLVPDHASRAGVGRPGSWLFIVALLALGLLVYMPGLSGGYVFDDFPNIVDNTALHVTALDWHDWMAATFSSLPGSGQRPLAMASFAVNHYFTGLDPVPMKLTNLSIHLLNTLLVLGLVRSLFAAASPDGKNDPRQEWAARFAAAAWALHPINLMAVLFIVQRMESLAHAFVFAGLWLYVVGRRRQCAGQAGWPWIAAGVLGCTALGVTAKESAALLPLYAFCLEWCLFRFRTGVRPEIGSGARDRGLLAFYAAVLVVPAVLGLAWLMPKVLAPGAWAHRDFTLAERLMTEARVVLDYLRWSVLPSLRELSLYHDDYPVSRGLLSPATTLPAILGVAALLATAVWLRRRRPLASLGLLWFLAAQMLTATVIQLELAYEHRNYFASLGICMLLADLLLLAPQRAGTRKFGMLLAGIALLAFAATTHLRAREWSDPVRFATSEAAKHPDSPRATYNLARTMVMLTGYRADSPLLAHADAALAKARAAPGNGVLAHSASLVLAGRSGRTPDPAWWKEFQQRLRRGPIGPQEISALASLTLCVRDGGCRFEVDDMMASYLAALSHGPHPDLLTIYGDYALNVLGDSDLALRLWRDASGMRPATAQYRVNLIKLLIARRDYRGAQLQIDELRRRGRLGQTEPLARKLEDRLQQASGGVRQ